MEPTYMAFKMIELVGSKNDPSVRGAANGAYL